ncbi:MAG: hypothetical protein H7331_01475 [Bacteroidia bacterium]|nr:hypothetical protein [Bacteroidia bacterium]
MKKIDLGNSSCFIGEELSIGANFKIGKNSVIRATKCVIGDNVSIGSDNSFLVGEELVINSNATLGNKNDITCLSCSFGEYLFLDSNVIIGHGGKFNYDSKIQVGKHCMICAYVKLNVNYAITIGDDVGIGEYVDVWTHGSFPPVLQGFPAQFGPVTIGNNVWLPAKSTVLANVTIGNDVVIGVNSLINKNLPSGCLAGGIPVKIIKENYYPNPNKEKNTALIHDVLNEYSKLMAFKNIMSNIVFNEIDFEIKCNDVIFNLNNQEVVGELNKNDEDFRDFLRRRGIKFFTGKPFVSVLPECYTKLLNYENN